MLPTGGLTTAPARRQYAPTRGARERLIKQRDRQRAANGARKLSADQSLVDAKTAAKLLGVPASWMLAQARAEKIPHHKIGRYVRFDFDELIAWVDQNRIPPR
jgi:excisionase family DNA binding protein